MCGQCLDPLTEWPLSSLTGKKSSQFRQFYIRFKSTMSPGRIQLSRFTAHTVCHGSTLFSPFLVKLSFPCLSLPLSLSPSLSLSPFLVPLSVPPPSPSLFPPSLHPTSLSLSAFFVPLSLLVPLCLLRPSLPPCPSLRLSSLSLSPSLFPLSLSLPSSYSLLFLPPSTCVLMMGSECLTEGTNFQFSGGPQR